MTQLAQCPSLRKIFSSRGRLSLWDMLEKLNSDEVIRPIAYLSSIGRKLTLFRHQMAQVGAVTVSLTAEELQHTKQAADRLLAVAHGLDMHAAIAACDDLCEAVALWSKHVQALSLDMITVLGDRAEQVVFCFGSEMRARSLYVMPPKYSNYLDPKEPLFGPVVHEKFKQKGRYEIAEAGRCLALGCNTACVFHLMRTVEVALEAVRLCLQLPIPQKKGDKTWGAALGSFEAELNNKDNLLWPKQWSSMADKKIFSEIHASLLLFKSEWRDPTMHLESTYDPDAAAHLFALVKGFMQKVANRLDETGHPYA